MTSPVGQIAVECHKCGVRYEDWYRPSINADLDPELAADVDYVSRGVVGDVSVVWASG